MPLQCQRLQLRHVQSKEGLVPRWGQRSCLRAHQAAERRRPCSRPRKDGCRPSLRLSSHLAAFAEPCLASAVDSRLASSVCHGERCRPHPRLRQPHPLLLHYPEVGRLEAFIKGGVLLGCAGIVLYCLRIVRRSGGGTRVQTIRQGRIFILDFPGECSCHRTYGGGLCDHLRLWTMFCLVKDFSFRYCLVLDPQRLCGVARVCGSFLVLCSRLVTRRRFAFRTCWDLEPTVPTGRSQNKDILTGLRVWVYLYEGGSRHTTASSESFFNTELVLCC